MTDTQNGFADRLKAVQRKHVRLAQGYDCKVGRDGLIVFRPKRRKASFPIRGLVLAVLAFVCFKGLVMAQIGPALYQSRVDTLGEGAVFERIGAFVMQADPVTVYIAETLAQVFR